MTTTTGARSTDGELGRVLLSLRGVQWVIGTKDDPYALLLRAVSDDPHELGDRIREHGPLYRSSAEVWVTARHDVGAAALRDPRLTQCPPEPEPVSEAPAGDGTLEADPMPWDVPALHDALPLRDAFLYLPSADHERLRGLVDGTRPERYAGEAETTTRRVVRRLGGAFDLVTDAIRPAVTAAAAALLGVPAGDRERFTTLCAGAAPALDATLCPPRLTTARELITSISGIHTLLGASVEAHRAAPPACLTGDLLRASDGGTGEPADVTTMSVLHAVSGVETTACLVGNAMAALLDHPEEADRLREDPGRTGAVIEETLRYAPPVRLQRLFAVEELELAGQSVAAGDQVVVAVEATGRDPEVFAEPERFRPGRESGGASLALAPGTVAGPVASVVRSQAAAVVRVLVTELPALRRAGITYRRLRSPVTGSALRLPVTTG